MANWTLVDGDWDLVANKSGATRLGFSLLLKFFELEGRFPDPLEEVPLAAVEYVADLVKVPASDFAKYALVSRTAEYHHRQIREALGFRPSTVAEEKALADWLAVGVCPVELVEDRQREALLVECRARKIEPPCRTRVERVLVAARGRWEKVFCARTIDRLGEVGTARLLSVVAEDNEEGTSLLAALKRDPGAVGLDSLLTEITKLNDVRRLGLPDGLFADCSGKLVAAWRVRAIKMYPSDFRDTSEDVRITLLAALCFSRQAEITDALVDLLVALVHKINARAERRVEKQLAAELKKVRGKEGMLFKLAEAAVDKPDEAVRLALYPVVGEKTLRELMAEAKANEKVFKAKVRTTLRSSCSSYYRQMLPLLLSSLGFTCNNTAYWPVMDAMKLLKKYADVDGKTRFYDAATAEEVHDQRAVTLTQAYPATPNASAAAPDHPQYPRPPGSTTRPNAENPHRKPHSVTTLSLDLKSSGSTTRRTQPGPPTTALQWRTARPPLSLPKRPTLGGQAATLRVPHEDGIPLGHQLSALTTLHMGGQ
ncbi:DUF4158 domain-containing protein [Streptomyces sp. RKAG293]|nr:DUF4158 domain-containing protein [Streptomyces sp. RKAG293]